MAALYLMTKIALILISLMAFAPLAKAEPASSVVWGRYCGECAVNCAEFYRLDNETMSADSPANFFEKYGANLFSYEFAGTQVQQEMRREFAWLLDAQWPTLEPDNQIFGQPDAYDQCGLLLFYTVEGHTYKALIDPNDVPESFGNIVERLYQ